MAKSNLITTSLISGIDWCKVAPASWKERADTDLSNQLNRIYGEMKPEVKQGIAFENTVYAKAYQEDRGGSESFNEVCDFVKDCKFQKKHKKFIDIDDEKYCLYAKLDAQKGKEIIIDIKTTKDYNKSKYLKSFQHILYCYITGIRNFTYIVVEWKIYPVIFSVNKVVIENIDLQECEQKVIDNVKSAMAYLKLRPELYKAYKENFCMY